MSIVTVNGRDVSATYGLRLLERGDVFGTPELERPRMPVPGRTGARVGALAVSDAKVIPMTWAIRSTEATRQASADTVLRDVFDGLVEVTFDDWTDRVLWAYADSIRIPDRFNGPLLSIGHVEVSCDLIVPAGVAFAREPTILKLPAGERVDLDLGTGTSSPTFYAGAGATDPSWTYRNGAGDVVHGLALDGTVTAGQTLRVRSALRSIVEIAEADGTEDGAPTYYDHTLTDGMPTSGGYPIFDPGDKRGDSPPSVEASDAGWVQYWKTYR